MGISRFSLGVAALSLAAVSFAQPPETPSPTPEKEEGGLSDLADTLNELSDPPPAEDGSAPTQALADEPEANSAPTDPDEGAQAQARDPAEPGDPTAVEEPEAVAEATARDESVPASLSSGGAPAVPPPISDEQRGEMEQAIARGRQLFALARAGSLATQDMLSRVADPEAAGITGWIAEPEGNSMAVTFYGEGEEGPVAIYRARTLGGRAVSRETFLTGDRPPLAGLSRRLAEARSASESEEMRACTSQPFNVLAIPPATPEEPILVYRISAGEKPSQVPLGGHYRSSVDAEGAVIETRPFSHGCLNVDVGEVPAGTQAGPIAVTHLLDPLPTEVHVFLSLVSRRPLVIAAGDPTRLFMVAGDSVREMRR